jgi:hypothetical protein
MDSTLADLYRRAVDELGLPSLTRATLAVAAHCVREIVNNLPEALGDVEDLPRRNDLGRPARDLDISWSKHEDVLGDPSVPRYAADSEEAQPGSMATVPSGILEAARVIVAAQRAGGTAGRLRHGAIVLGRLEQGRDASVDAFRVSVDFFMDNVHLARATNHPPPDINNVVSHLETIEAALSARFGGFFDTVAELFDVIELANRTSDSDQP